MVKLKNTEITREYIEGSFSRLDILAKTSIGESDLLSVWVGFLEDPNNEKVIYLEKRKLRTIVCVKMQEMIY